MSAVFSEDGKHRYLLERDVVALQLTGCPAPDPARILGLIMVNPSTAGAEVNDPTITRVFGFAQRLGYGKVMVGNKFSHVATDVKELRAASLPSGGTTNDRYLDRIVRECTTLVFGWGPLAKLPKHLRLRWRRVLEIAQAAGKTPMCWGTAADGHPRHPLMLSYDTPLVPWTGYVTSGA